MPCRRYSIDMASAWHITGDVLAGPDAIYLDLLVMDGYICAGWSWLTCSN